MFLKYFLSVVTCFLVFFTVAFKEEILKNFKDPFDLFGVYSSHFLCVQRNLCLIQGHNDFSPVFLLIVS